MSKELRCPRCNGDQIVADGAAHIEYDTAYQDMICEECELDFYATFIFDDVQEF